MIGSNTIVEVKGQRVRGRLYPWGIVEGQYSPAWTRLDTCGTVKMFLCLCSGESVSLWFRQAEEHADSLAHARPKGHHVWRALWKLQSSVHTADDKVKLGILCWMKRFRLILKLSFVSVSKLTQDNRVESPIPILPLSTPDVETEKLIKMKDEEVSCPVPSYYISLHKLRDKVEIHTF